MRVEENPTKPGVRGVHPLIRWLSFIYLVPRREWLRRRIRRTTVERVCNLNLVVPSGVYNPVAFRTGIYFSEFLADSEYCDPRRFARQSASRALDCTTGTGAQALVLARRGFDVTAVDINPEAVRAARCNVLLNDMERGVRVLEGDLFEPVRGSEFEVVVSALPLFRGKPDGRFELSWRSPDIIERFAHGLSAVLAPDGICLALFTTDGDQEGFLRALQQNSLNATVVADKHLGNEITSVYCIRR